MSQSMPKFVQFEFEVNPIDECSVDEVVSDALDSAREQLGDEEVGLCVLRPKRLFSSH